MKQTLEKLVLYGVVPYLNLPSTRNGKVNLWDLKQTKNLVIFFHHGVECAPCQAKLKELAQAYDRVKELEAEVLAVSFDILEKLKSYAQGRAIPFPLLSDQTGETAESFTHKDSKRNAPFPSIFITDRFGALRYQKITSESHELPDAKEILDWLLLIQTECPECSHL